MKAIQRIRYWNRARRFAKVHETQECRFVKDCVSLGQIALDIGANKGAFSYWLSEAVGSEGRVFAFEPQPELAREIERMNNALRHGNITVSQSALSNKPGMETLRVPENHTCASLESRGEDGARAIEVRLDTLDAFAERNGVQDQIDFIKCDVEGHELSVFQGATATLAGSRPTILFESFIPHTSESSNEVFEFLFQVDYQGYGFSGAQLRPVDLLRNTRDHHNFVFLPKERALLSDAAPYRLGEATPPIT